uniref:apolipoprotein L3-like n=1 Tax=Monopterus albus TaxID=43700 RepID=UPI0009B49B03|nr:apolipoprotein L3-like [Monopterus albus]XP_020441216.1 apolipoprotein L3-like [Monopterus albus]
MGGITAVVGLILAPFTLGASLIVTGVGVGVSTLGGVAAGASNITNMVNQSSDRKAVRSIIKEFEEKINAVVTWLQEICNSVQAIRNTFQTADVPGTMDSSFSDENLARLGLRAGRGLGAIPELIRLVQVVNIGKIAAQATRAVRVAEAVTGVLSALFLAVDIFFIAVDAKEIHHIRQAKAAEERTNSQPVSETETEDSVSTFDKAVLVVKESDSAEPDKSEEKNQSSSETTQTKSEIMKFVKSVREAADNLQEVLDEIRSIISSIPSFGDESDLE